MIKAFFRALLKDFTYSFKNWWGLHSYPIYYIGGFTGCLIFYVFEQSATLNSFLLGFFIYFVVFTPIIALTRIFLSSFVSDKTQLPFKTYYHEERNRE